MDVEREKKMEADVNDEVEIPTAKQRKHDEKERGRENSTDAASRYEVTSTLISLGGSDVVGDGVAARMRKGHTTTTTIVR